METEPGEKSRFLIPEEEVVEEEEEEEAEEEAEEEVEVEEGPLEEGARCRLLLPHPVNRRRQANRRRQVNRRLRVGHLPQAGRHLPVGLPVATGHRADPAMAMEPSRKDRGVSLNPQPTQAAGR